VQYRLSILIAVVAYNTSYNRSMLHVTSRLTERKGEGGNYAPKFWAVEKLSKNSAVRTVSLKNGKKLKLRSPFLDKLRNKN